MGRERQTKAKLIHFVGSQMRSVQIKVTQYKQIPREKMLVSFLDELHQESRDNYLSDLRQAFCKG
jgi:hypothetical protein